MSDLGYVTYAEEQERERKDPEESVFTIRVTLKIPNEEIRACFRNAVSKLYGKEGNPQWYQQAQQLVDLLMNDHAEEAASLISSMLKQFLSIRNSGSELYYHGFLVGVLVLAASSMQVKVRDEAESEDGYTDIILKRGSTAAVLELKRAENTVKGLHKACQDAKQQIVEKDYVRGLIKEDCTTVYGLGLGFWGQGLCDREPWQSVGPDILNGPYQRRQLTLALQRSSDPGSQPAGSYTLSKDMTENKKAAEKTSNCSLK